MSVRWMMTLLVGLTLSAAVLVSPVASAQVFSSKGVKQEAEAVGINRCADEAMDVQQRVLTLNKRINLILDCNRVGKVYNTGMGVCTEPAPDVLSPDHRYTPLATGSTLTFVNPDGTDGSAFVVGGRAGHSITCVENPVGCDLPWGGSIEHGKTVVAYKVQGGSCTIQTNKETRTCNNGVLTGSYTYANCDSSCKTPWNTSVADGETVTAYQSAKNCSNSETRTCKNGVLSGSYAYGSCDASCTTPWNTTVANGQSVTAYQSQNSSDCTSEQRTCTNGSLSGSYRYESCEPEAPTTPQPPTKDCFFWVSGYTPPYGVIGSDDDGSNHVGAGAYPDATVPFAKANAKTFDMIAIGPKTRLIIYKKTNFQGGKYIDIHGPKVIGNKCLAPRDTFPRDWKTNPVVRLANSSPDHQGTKYLSVKSSIYSSMFPPSTRVEYDMNKTSAGCTSGAPASYGNYTRDQLMWGGGSVKVICDGH